MILGLYEQEVMENLVGAPARFGVFVDVGAADGYYAVGLLYSGRVDRSVAFESLPEGREAIARLAAENGVSDKITILGTASDHFDDTIRVHKINSQESMFLIDIEGAAFKVLTEKVFVLLKDSLIVVETHAHIYADPQGRWNASLRPLPRHTAQRPSLQDLVIPGRSRNSMTSQRLIGGSSALKGVGKSNIGCVLILYKMRTTLTRNDVQRKPHD
jgi:hypothetical protein